MPTHALVQLIQKWDGALARDHIVNDLTYRWADFTLQDATSLANNVMDAWDATFSPTNSPEFVAKVYDLEGSKPVLPMATVVRRPGQLQNSGTPRELCLCLSFAGGQYQPRQRGRIYVHHAYLGSAVALRPTSVNMQKLATLGGNLEAVGGTNVDWIVWSRVNRSATKVSKTWVDDEYDTQRSRGLRATTRIENHY